MTNPRIKIPLVALENYGTKCIGCGQWIYSPGDNLKGKKLTCGDCHRDTCQQCKAGAINST